MKLELSIAEANELIKEIRQPDALFEMIRDNVKQSVGRYLSGLMNVELTSFLGRGWYERGNSQTNHRNGSYGRLFTLKGIEDVKIKVPRDRNGKLKIQVIPKSKRYEDEIREDLRFIFLTGIISRSLSMISRKLIGQRVPSKHVCNNVYNFLKRTLVAIAGIAFVSWPS